jgi:hypothetical protein
MTRAAAATSTLVAVLIVQACGSARISRTPLVALPAVEAGGSGVRQLGAVAIVEYTPTRNFGIAFVVKNRSGRRITVTGVSSTDSGRRFLRPLQSPCEGNLDGPGGSGCGEVQRQRSYGCRLLQRLPSVRHHEHPRRAECWRCWLGRSVEARCSRRLGWLASPPNGRCARPHGHGLAQLARG